MKLINKKQKKILILNAVAWYFIPTLFGLLYYILMLKYNNLEFTFLILLLFGGVCAFNSILIDYIKFTEANSKKDLNK